MKICIDPGHGGGDCGAIGYLGVIPIYEAWINLIASLSLGSKLIKRRHQVLFTRIEDIFIPTIQRAGIANDKDCDFFISIHVNAFDDPTVCGFEILHYPNSVYGIKLATKVITIVHDNEIRLHGSGLVPRDDLVVLKRTKMPAILIELGFLTNPFELGYLYNDIYLDRLLILIADAVSKFFG